MNLELSDEQVMLREAAADALSRLDTIGAARAALDGAPCLDIWPTACAAGWPGLLIPESYGGAGLGFYDAMLVSEECGRRLTGAGLLGHLPATLLLSRAAAAGDSRAAAELPALATGSHRAALVQERGRTPFLQSLPAQPVKERGPSLFLHVPDARGADVLVVAFADGRVALVDSAEVEPLVRFDASRPLAHVRFDEADAVALSVPDGAVDEAWYLAQSLLAADALGVSLAMLEMAVAYSKERYAFGRAIGSFQAIKQQLVEILRHTETARNLCVYAGLAAEQLPEDLALAASGARFAGEQAADYATRTCIAVHGGIGATWEHDAPLYWRRAQLSRLLLGGVAGASDRVAEEILARARVHARAPAHQAPIAQGVT